MKREDPLPSAYRLYAIPLGKAKGTICREKKEKRMYCDTRSGSLPDLDSLHMAHEH